VVFLTTQQKYTLKQARELLGMSRRDLRKASGISLAAINAVEKGGQYKTSESVAEALADAVALDVNEIEWPRGLSHLGRPAKTGKPIVYKRTFTVSVTEEVTVTSDQPMCIKHFVTYPRDGECDRCS
jgi:DNA-binding XRE family transcriptional regulator